MECPAAPLLLLLLPLHAAASTTPAPSCFAAVPDAVELDLSNNSLGCTELDWGPFQRQSRLWLSHNGIEALSPSSRVGPGLEELDLSYNRLRELPPAFLSAARGLRRLQLQHNRLRHLPDGIFASATALQTLNLEGNPLPAVPPTAFQPSLRLLTLPCRCDVVSSVLAACTCSQPNCTAPQCHCLASHHDSFNVTYFHSRECQHNAGLVATVAGAAGGVALLVLVVVGVLWYRRRKAAAAAADTVWGKWEPTVVHGQPRYISRATEIGTAEATTAAPDYENVFVSPCAAPAAARGWAPGWQEEQHSSQVPLDSDYFLGSEAPAGDQPIYANTRSPAEDTTYIIPDP